jgi:hypothetical protein
MLGDMARAEVESVLVGPGFNRRNVTRFFTDLLGRRPERVGGVELWLDVDPAALLAATPVP